MSTVVGITVIVFAIASIGFAGYRVYCEFMFGRRYSEFKRRQYRARRTFESDNGLRPGALDRGK